MSRSGREGNTKLRERERQGYTTCSREEERWGYLIAFETLSKARFEPAAIYVWSCWQPITFPEPENIGSRCISRRCTQEPQIINQTITPSFLFLRFNSTISLPPFLAFSNLSIYPSTSLFPFHAVSRAERRGRESLFVADRARAFKLVHHRVGYAPSICLVVQMERRG